MYWVPDPVPDTRPLRPPELDQRRKIILAATVVMQSTHQMKAYPQGRLQLVSTVTIKLTLFNGDFQLIQEYEQLTHLPNQIDKN